MTRFAESRFSVYYGGKMYADNYEFVFGKPKSVPRQEDEDEAAEEGSDHEAEGEDGGESGRERETVPEVR